MNIKYRTIPHPNKYIDNRDVTLLFVNNELDIPSSKFLIHSARFGGRGKYLAGRKSHKPKAVKLGELFRHLDDMGLTWRTATEHHIEIIRNAMLCWNQNREEDYGNFNYDPILPSSVNQKLDTWFSFYKHMDAIGEDNEMALTTIRVKKRTHRTQDPSLLKHLGKRADNTEEFIERWILKVKEEAKDNKFHAISRTEYSHLEQHLIKDDLVFGVLAYIMAETGLRVEAALEISEKIFKNAFIHLNSRKDEDDTVPFSYINKGGETRTCRLPIRTIIRVQKLYMTRELVKRRRKHLERSRRLDSTKYNEEALWLNKNGKVVNYRDLLNAFSRASKKMGRNIDNITPHWMRHTFATWAFMDYAHDNHIDIKAIDPEKIDAGFTVMLQSLLGHSSTDTQKKYLASALFLERVGLTKGVIMSLKGFKRDKEVQKLIEREAMIEFGDNFRAELFDVFSYASKRGIVVDDSWVGR